MAVVQVGVARAGVVRVVLVGVAKVVRVVRVVSAAVWAEARAEARSSRRDMHVHCRRS